MNGVNSGRWQPPALAGVPKPLARFENMTGRFFKMCPFEQTHLDNVRHIPQ
jgi:hypothetical protein